jgi:chorismate synthase
VTSLPPVVRELREHSDYVAAQRVAQRVWRMEELQVPSTFDLQVAGHIGGMTAGAYCDGVLAGFVHGFPRTDLGRPAHHSHLLAVLPEFRGRGLSVRLKLFQRRWCLARGIRLVTWTYDPLLVANARLNLVRLRARARIYLRNVYGELGGLYGPLPTDRFEVFWNLGSAAVGKVAKVAKGARGVLLEPGDWESLPRATPRRLPRAHRLAVEIPVGAPALYADDPAAALRARLRLRRIAEALFDRGYEAVALVPRGEAALYVFER